MSPKGAIAANHLWKRFRPDRTRMLLRDSLESAGHRLRKRKGKGKTPWSWALRDVDFAVEPGQAVGLVGANGSGKSTLLKILTRVMYPYAGSVEVNGRVGALIEVASGIHPDLTGRENAYLYGTLLGLDRKAVSRRFDEIVAFAELEHAIDRQVKFFSSGMKMRLGFAVAAFLEPDILLVDEVLSVGDASFQQRCLDRIRHVINEGTTIVYVSHDLPTVEASCTRALWLHRGVVQRDGPVRDVLGDYRRAIEHQVELEDTHQGILRVVEAVATGVDGGVAKTSEPLDTRFVFSSPIASPARIFIGVTEGPGTPILLVGRDLLISEGKTEVRCRLEDLPLPAGRYFVWACVLPRGRGAELLPWGPVAHFDVTGPRHDLSPRGVVQVAPVYSRTEWDVR
jgi:ABC-type polysaccharide/polyol phosphate transport system ATPase subunit